MNALDDAEAQQQAVATFFDALAAEHPRLPAMADAANDSAARLRA
jgi:hypothetical protein